MPIHSIHPNRHKYINEYSTALGVPIMSVYIRYILVFYLTTRVEDIFNYYNVFQMNF